MQCNDVDTQTITALSICSGVGGLELGVRLVLPGLRVLAYGERDLSAARILAARMDDGSLDPAPIWSDVTRFDGRRWAGAVDIVMGGIPCQPFSVAGQRRGRDDERWIWPDIWRWVRDVRPGLIFLENVPGFVRHGLPVVLGNLAEAGYDATWDCFSAAEAGAPHKRVRLFVLAHCDRERQLQPGGTDGNERRRAGDGGVAVADPHSAGLETYRWEGAVQTELAVPECNSDAMAGADAFPPGPGDDAGWRRWLEAGGPAPVESGVHGSAYGAPGGLDRLADRSHRLFVLGNGVVPEVAGYAFATLAGTLGLAIGGES